MKPVSKLPINGDKLVAYSFSVDRDGPALLVAFHEKQRMANHVVSGTMLGVGAVICGTVPVRRRSLTSSVKGHPIALWPV